MIDNHANLHSLVPPLPGTGLEASARPNDAILTSADALIDAAVFTPEVPFGMLQVTPTADGQGAVFHRPGYRSARTIMITRSEGTVFVSAEAELYNNGHVDVLNESYTADSEAVAHHGVSTPTDIFGPLREVVGRPSEFTRENPASTLQALLLELGSFQGMPPKRPKFQAIRSLLGRLTASRSL